MVREWDVNYSQQASSPPFCRGSVSALGSHASTVGRVQLSRTLPQGKSPEGKTLKEMEKPGGRKTISVGGASEEAPRSGCSPLRVGALRLSFDFPLSTLPTPRGKERVGRVGRKSNPSLEPQWPAWFTQSHPRRGHSRRDRCRITISCEQRRETLPRHNLMQAMP